VQKGKREAKNYLAGKEKLPMRVATRPWPGTRYLFQETSKAKGKESAHDGRLKPTGG
jgi:hypothetical protein